MAKGAAGCARCGSKIDPLPHFLLEADDVDEVDLVQRAGGAVTEAAAGEGDDPVALGDQLAHAVLEPLEILGDLGQHLPRPVEAAADAGEAEMLGRAGDADVRRQFSSDTSRLESIVNH